MRLNWDRTVLVCTVSLATASRQNRPPVLRTALNSKRAVQSEIAAHGAYNNFEGCTGIHHLEVGVSRGRVS